MAGDFAVSELAHRLASITATLGHTRSLQLALIAATAVSLASLAGIAASSVGPQLPAARATSAPPALDPAALAAAHLFGRAGAQREEPVTAPPPRPDWVLQGVFTGATPAAGSAIITTGRQPARLYQAGEQLPGGATLVEIYPDRVALDLDGAIHNLEFPAISAAGEPGRSLARATASSPVDMTTGSERRRELVRKRLEMLRQRALGSS